ncbi:DUF6346 domain-containing protein [Micromonospora zamorensis]|nr:DUF6346 domain-containing protein [Micromonospora zamorensis]
MAEIQRKQIAAYEQRGPFWGRLTQFGAAVAAVAAIVVTTLVCDTVASFYPGTGVVKSSPAERPAEATVRDCRRVGPVSGDGFGYWWHCEVTIRTHDGREVDTVVKHSIVTPDDRGKPVEFREACYEKDNADCRYGRPAWRVWALALEMLRMVRNAMLMLLLCGVWYALQRTVLGVPRYYARLRRREAKKPVSRAEERLRGLMEGVNRPAAESPAQLMRNQSAPSGGTRSAADAAIPCHGTSCACTSPRLPTPDPP